MDYKEATASPIAVTSSGSYPSPSPSPVSDNENVLKSSVLDTDVKGNIGNGIKDIVSDEEDEGGYVSGPEEFETASEQLGLGGSDGETVEKVDEDKGFDETSENSKAEVDALPISGVSENDIGDEKRINDDEKGGVSFGKNYIDASVAVVNDSDTKDSEVAGIEGLEEKGEIRDSGLEEGVKESVDGDFPDSSENKEVKIAEVNTEKVEEEEEVEMYTAKAEGGESAGGDFPDSSESKEVENGGFNADKEVEEEVEIYRDKAEDGGVNLTPEGDSSVGTNEVDISQPGVASVQPTDGDINPVEAPVDESGELVGVEEASNVKITSEGDSVGGEEMGKEVKPIDAVVETSHGVEEEGRGVEFMPEGDAIIDTIKVEPPVPTNPGVVVVGEKMDEEIDEKAVDYVANGDHVDVKTTDLDNIDGSQDVDNVVMKSQDNGTRLEVSNDREVEPLLDQPEITEDKDEGEYQLNEEVDDHEDFNSDDETDGMIFGSSEAAKQFIEELERGSGGGSGGDSLLGHSQGIDGQIVTDSEEEGDTDEEEEGDRKELFDSAALAALLKAATGADTDGGGNITITSQDGSRLFSVERPAGLGSSLRSLRPAPLPNRPNLFTNSALSGRGESDNNLSEEEKTKLEKLQQIRVKFLRLVHRLGLSPEESVAAQVLYRFSLLAGRQNGQVFSIDAAKRMAMELEAEGKDDLDFNVNILVLGKSGVGKSGTINSIFGEEKAPIAAFGSGTTSVEEISGIVDGVKVVVSDTPGLKSNLMEQAYNRHVLSSVKKFTKKSSPDVVLYVDRLDSQTRDLNDLPLLRTVTSVLGPSIWRSAIVTLTHGASAPPEGPSGSPLSYEAFVAQRSHVVQQSIGHAVGDLRMMSPSLMNPVSLVENHPSCRKNREGQKILPNGQSWRSQLLLLCYSMKILSEASSLSKPQDPIDQRKLFGFRVRSPPLPYMLSSMLQSRPHPKLPSEQGGDNGDSDIDLDDYSDSDQEGEDEYDQLPSFKPLRKHQIEMLSKEQRKAYFEEYDYRVKLLQKKQFKDEIRRMKEIRKRGKAAPTPGYGEEEDDGGAAAPVAVPLPDMALPPTFDGDNPAYRYRFLEPTSQFLARPVLDSHGWDHDCGYDGVNLEHGLAILNRFPAAFTVQLTKDKKDFTLSLDSSVSVKHGDKISTMAGFDIQSIGKQLAYIVRGETKFKNIKKNKAAGGVSVTFLGENVVPGLKIEDQITLGKQFVLVGSCGAVRSQTDTAIGANFELQRKELDSPVGQVQSTLSMSVIKWRGDLALGFNGLAQFSIGRNSKVAVRAGINNKRSGQITVRTSNSENLTLALAAVLPTAISIYRKFWPGAGVGEKYAIY